MEEGRPPSDWMAGGKEGREEGEIALNIQEVEFVQLLLLDIPLCERYMVHKYAFMSFQAYIHDGTHVGPMLSMTTLSLWCRRWHISLMCTELYL